MKCISCNNEIPDASVTCPYCKKSVEPAVPAQPVYNVENTSALPQTPAQPVLPQDQGMANTPVAPAEPIENVISPETQAIPDAAPVEVIPQAPIVEVPVQAAPQPQVVQAAPQVVPQPQVVQVQAQPQVVQAQPQVVETQVTAPVDPMAGAVREVVGGNDVLAVPENGKAPEYINASGQVVDGQKISNSLPVEEKKTVNKKKIITLAVVAIIVVILIVCGVLFYTSQFKSANKRVDAVIDGLLSPITTLSNDKINKQTGKYNVDIEVGFDKNTIKSNVDGTYGKDLKNEAIDLTLNLKSLEMDKQMVDSPINLEVYYNDSKLYLLFQNFYNNYIYDEYHDFDDMFKQIEKNDINYSLIISGYKSAVVAGIDSLIKEQNVGKATINGNTSTANIVKFNLNEFNVGNFYNSYYMSILNNQMFIDEYAKLLNKKADDLKSELDKKSKEVKASDTKTTIEVYTGLFNKSLVGIKITNENKVIEIYPSGSGYAASYKEGSQNLFEGSYTKAVKSTSVTLESTYDINFTVYVNELAYKSHIVFENIEDINPKDAKVYVKNSINKKYITEADKQTILDKASKTGSIGLYLPSIIKYYLPVSEESNPNIVNGQEVASEDVCLAAEECQPYEVEGYNTCKKLDTREDIICRIN